MHAILRIHNVRLPDRAQYVLADYRSASLPASRNRARPRRAPPRSRRAPAPDRAAAPTNSFRNEDLLQLGKVFGRSCFHGT